MWQVPELAMEHIWKAHFKEGGLKVKGFVTSPQLRYLNALESQQKVRSSSSMWFTQPILSIYLSREWWWSAPLQCLFPSRDYKRKLSILFSCICLPDRPNNCHVPQVAPKAVPPSLARRHFHPYLLYRLTYFQIIKTWHEVNFSIWGHLY